MTELELYADVIHGLHDKWSPHDGQWSIIDDMFNGGIDSAFVRCGRKWGKTEFGIYALWRVAKQYPGSPCYYFAPEQKQAREILWSDPRLQNFGPSSWLMPKSRGINESQMMLRFKNGSTIHVDGTDNFNNKRGVKYKIAVYDEYKDADPRMRRSMRPNASVLGGIDLYMGSPPEKMDTDYRTLEEEHRIDPKMRSYHEPSWRNPHISKQWLLDEKTKLYRRGEGDEWEREYGAKYVRGGAHAIFPMLDESMVKPHEQIMHDIRKDLKKLHWFWWSDPAGASTFAVLFVAINPYSKKVYVLDEIYEQDQKRMTVRVIGEEICEKKEELNHRAEWRQGYDEAATWFSNEWSDNFPDQDGLEPSQKGKHDKTNGLSLIKDIMLLGKLVISDRCKKFWWELENYIKDKNGNIPKKNDHLIDDFRYILGAEHYDLKRELEELREKNEMFRGEALRFTNIQDPYKEA